MCAAEKEWVRVRREVNAQQFWALVAELAEAERRRRRYEKYLFWVETLNLRG